MIQFTVPAVPVSQPRQRVRVMNIGGRAIAQNFTPAKAPVNAFKAAVAAAFAGVYSGPPLEGPVALSVVFVMPRPGRLIWKTKPMPRVPHASKPDADNLCKSTTDALLGLAYRDDSQIAELRARKVYAAGDEQPHATVTIEKIEATA